MTLDEPLRTFRVAPLADGAIQYAECGFGPPAILLNGMRKDKWLQFLDCSDHLVGCRYIAVDLPELPGLDAVPVRDDETNTQVGLLVAFLDELGIQAVDIATDSWGFAAATEFRRRFPLRVRMLTRLTIGKEASSDSDG